MRLVLPTKLFGRVYKAPKHPMKALLKNMWCADLPVPPPAFDVDQAIGLVFPPRLYHNDVEGDCVIAARANQQTRFIAQRTGVVPVISDDEVQAEYLSQTGGQDTGLVPDDSLALWRSKGWTCIGAHHSIQAWGRVNATDKLDVQRAISLLGGIQLSLELPNIWSDALDNKQSWDVPTNSKEPNAQLGSWGGHQVWVKSYDTNGVTCMTWGQSQLITWAGLAWAGTEVNQGEAEAVVRCDDAGPSDVLDINKLMSELKEIQE